MAKRIITTIELTDDLDGGEAESTVTFSFDGSHYEIDLSKKNANAMTKMFKSYVDAARKVRQPRGRATPSAKPAKRSDLADVRAWAAQNGHEVSDRGRVPASVLEAYDAR